MAHMNRPHLRTIIAIFMVAFIFTVLAFQPVQAQTPTPVVQAVLFFSPSCGHCFYVITEVLPPLFEQHGEQLQMMWIDVTTPEGNVFFIQVLQSLGLERGVVPFLVVGSFHLAGSAEIPEQFPGLIDTFLAEGGVSFPDLPGMSEYRAAMEATQAALLSITPLASPTLTGTPPAAETVTQAPLPPTPAVPFLPPEPEPQNLAKRLGNDPAGNGLAIIILAAMLAAVGWAGHYFLRRQGFRWQGALRWMIPALCLAGLSVAGYLTYVEMNQVEAWCGVVGDCNTVQQSEYARLFGILPVGVLGLAGYITILAAWAVGWSKNATLVFYSDLTGLLLTVLATLFSIYLTFLEPFVIGATCAWCLASAVISTLLFLTALPPGRQAARQWMQRVSR